MHTRSVRPELRRVAGSGLIGLCLGALLVSCASNKPDSRYSQAHDSAPDVIIDPATVKDAVPRAEPKSRWGNAPSYVVRGTRYHTLPSSRDYVERGIASWYGTKFHGHRTSNGETYDMYQMSAAHKSLPLPTYARVTNLRNSKSVIVKINDRGPFHENRLIDLSYAAAAKLGILGEGTGLVEVRAIDPQQYLAEQQRPRIAPSQPKVAAQQRPATAAAQAQPEQLGATRHQSALYLQLGAFADRDNAERLRTRLASIQLPGPVQISEATNQQQRVYRVRIGPLQTVESADQATQILAAQGISSPRVVID